MNTSSTLEARLDMLALAVQSHRLIPQAGHLIGVIARLEAVTQEA